MLLNRVPSLSQTDRLVRVVRPLAQIGAALIVLTFLACGRTGGVGDSDGDMSGGAGGGGAASGGSSSGGAGSGGAASGGAGSGGTGSGGTGGVDGDVTACPGTPPPSGQSYPTCRTQADCTNGGSCQANAPSGDGLCGVCFAPAEECVVDTDCGDDEVCVTGPELSCQCMGPGLVCAPACTAGSCGDTEVCGEDGHCGPASCTDDGYACAEGTVCDPERTGDAHGCTPSLCDDDDYVCSPDTVCEAERAGDAHHCAPRRCDTEDYTCPDDAVCEATESSNAHGCRPVHCSEGLECPANHDCDSATDIPNGCVRRSCTTDANCDCGACVMGYCQDRLFLCVVLPA